MTKHSFQHFINSRNLTTHSPSIESELKLNQNKNYLFNLSWLSVLDVTGEKALDFLQGQLTCDVRVLLENQLAQGAQCNLKGRILTLMDIISHDSIKLILPGDLVDATQVSLSKTALLSRVSLQENKKLKVFGFLLQNVEDLLPVSSFSPGTLYADSSNLEYCYYPLSNGFYIFLIDDKIEDHFVRPFVDKKQYLGSLTWHTLRLNEGQINIYPESRGLFLPHRLDLHQSNYISFNKGCYKGQEIIARTHYKATLKHELKTYEITTNQRIYSGQKLISIDGTKELGEIIDYSLLGKDHYLVAVSILKEGAMSVLIEGNSEVVELKHLS